MAKAARVKESGRHVTVDRREIRRWAEARGASPSVVKGVRGKGPGILRMDLPGYTGEDSLQHVEWDRWFDAFEQSNLAFLYQERTARGQRSNFNKLVGRETVDLRTGRTKVQPPRRERKAVSARTAGATQRTTTRKPPAAKKPRATRRTPPRARR